MPFHPTRSWPCALLLLATLPAGPQTGAPAPHPPTTHPPAQPPAQKPTPAGRPAGWHLLYEEKFDGPAPFSETTEPAWVPDTHQQDDKFSDGGEFFTQQGIKPPAAAFRAEASFGQNHWLTVAAYSRSSATKFSDLFQVVPDPAVPDPAVSDPATPTHRVLKVSSPQSTDGLVIRSTNPLPARYRVCLRVGYADYGDGKPGAANLNGYLGGETAEPWGNDKSSSENGFYWLTILDATPRPHNNIWIHHHRKVVIDSDNNKDAWTNIWEGSSWVADGQHPIMMFGLDKTGWDNGDNGLPFLAWSNGALQPSGEIRAVDAYKDNTWYSACIERNPTNFVLTVSGDFKFGGQQTYTGTIPIAGIYQAEPGIPDFFMFGDPHNNYYRGTVYYDDIKLETWQAKTP